MNWEHDRQNAANSVQSIEAKIKSTSVAVQEAQVRLAAARATSETRCRDADTVWSAVQHNRPAHRQIVDAILEPTAEPSVTDTRGKLALVHQPTRCMPSVMRPFTSHILRRSCTQICSNLPRLKLIHSNYQNFR